jgi:hypothetical protein
MHRDACILRVPLAPAVVGLALWAAGARAESYVIVRVTDMLKAETHQVMTTTEFKDLQKTVQNEAKYFMQAEQATQKAWKEDELNKRVPFPGTRLAPRKAEIKGQFVKKEEAQAKLERLEELEARKADREAELMMALSKKDANQAKLAKERQEKEAEKAADAVRAHEILQAKLKEIMEKSVAKPAPKDGEAKPTAEDAQKAVNKAL